jgi:hypothetical protein
MNHENNAIIANQNSIQSAISAQEHNLNDLYSILNEFSEKLDNYLTKDNTCSPGLIDKANPSPENVYSRICKNNSDILNIIAMIKILSINFES